MYGLLEVAEAVRQGRTIETIADRAVRTPHPFRAVKFNLPRAAYRTNEAITLHMDTCRDLAFWEAFLDMMAENRFNALTLWNLPPFPFMIRPDNFPEASPFEDAGRAEWQALFSDIFGLARNRGIETYMVNWNIFVSPEFAEAHYLPGRANITSARGATPQREELVKRYTRECVTQVLNEYPDLTGIGFSEYANMLEDHAPIPAERMTTSPATPAGTASTRSGAPHTTSTRITSTTGRRCYPAFAPTRISSNARSRDQSTVASG